MSDKKIVNLLKHRIIPSDDSVEIEELSDRARYHLSIMYTISGENLTSIDMKSRANSIVRWLWETHTELRGSEVLIGDVPVLTKFMTERLIDFGYIARVVSTVPEVVGLGDERKYVHPQDDVIKWHF